MDLIRNRCCWCWRKVHGSRRRVVILATIWASEDNSLTTSAGLVVPNSRFEDAPLPSKKEKRKKRKKGRYHVVAEFEGINSLGPKGTSIH